MQNKNFTGGAWIADGTAGRSAKAAAHAGIWHVFETRTLRPLGLLVAAVIWGLLWLPMRLLARAGIPGEWSVLIIYSLVLGAFALLRPRTYREWRTAPFTLLPVGLFAGWSNVGFILGVIQGEVLRVTLLFYLAPLWSVLLARLLLGERLARSGYVSLAVALAGMLLVLGRPGRWPLPQSAADWLGLSAGLSFAMGNVLARRARKQTIPARALTIAIGMVLVSAAVIVIRSPAALPGGVSDGPAWSGLFLLLALLALVSSLSIQFGLQYTPATEAAILLLFELVVAAASATLLAGERMPWQEWLGGLLIVAAGFTASRFATPAVVTADQATGPGQEHH